MKVLVTGAAGYIGSTVASLLSDHGFKPIVLDSLVQGQPEFIASFPNYVGDIADEQLLERIFADHPDIEALMHFAALIDVEESTRKPALYYSENLCKSLILLQNVLKRGVRRLIFSSTAAIYKGSGGELGIPETAAIEPLSPYARSKLMFEDILSDVGKQAGASTMVLRYFNPIGADPLLRSGPYKTDATHILGKLLKLVPHGGEFVINGDDYPTRDGTPIRDYIHVWDLAKAHLAALSYVSQPLCRAFSVINVGSGSGVTVREFAEAFQAVTGVPLTIRVGGRRPGDTAGAFADTRLAAQLLDWSPERSLEEGIADSLRWQGKADIR